MNKTIILILVLFLLNNCSLSENSKIWQDKEKELENNKNIQKVFSNNKKKVIEFNPKLKLNLTNYDSQNYKGVLDKVGNYKFSKLDNINQLNFKPAFLNKDLFFFDKKGSIIRYDNNQKILWKNNYYSKSEKKLRPKLSFAIDNENLIVADNIAKYYSININSGKLNWSKYNTYPFNSEIRKYKNKIFVVDYKNTLRCYNINDGSECWNLKTEDSFTISNSKFSLILNDNTIIFTNSIGDITAVDIKTGLLKWQLPTQSSDIINETYNFKMSKLVSDGESIFFSNNKNEFYSVDLKLGTTNWISEINSIVAPVITGNLIHTVSREGYLIVIDKNKGNIIRINDIFKNYKPKKRKNINPVGFVINNNLLYLTNSDGKMIIIDLNLGNIIKVVKVDGDFISSPFILDKNLYVIKNGSIIQYN